MFVLLSRLIMKGNGLTIDAFARAREHGIRGVSVQCVYIRRAPGAAYGRRESLVQAEARVSGKWA